MKLVNAYVRAHMAHHVVEELVRAGCRAFSVLQVQGISHHGGPGLEFSMQLGDSYELVRKIEVVCRDDDAAQLAELIRRAACTGRDGDGLVYVVPVDESVRISNGARGDAAIA